MDSKNRQDVARDWTLSFPPARMPAESMVAPRRAHVNDAPEEQRTFVDALVANLEALGVEYAFGIFGGGIAPFSEALNRSRIRLLHFRHEAGAAFAAIEASLASDKPVVVFGTTGPGMTNMLTGMFAARWEGAKVIFVSGCTPASQRGRWAFQETSAHAPGLPNLFVSGTLFHYAAMVEDPAQLESVAARLATGVRRPNGFVAHLGLPNSVQTARSNAGLSSSSPSSLRSLSIPAGDDETIRRCARLLSSGNFVIWAGFGARHAAHQVRELSERSGAMVMCSPRGKGILPEDHPNFLGVTGLGAQPRVEAYMRSARPAHVLVLGSRLGEFTSFYSPDLLPSESFIHVDVDAEVFGAAYPDVETVGVQSEIGLFLGGLLRSWPADHSPRHFDALRPVPTVLASREEPLVRPSYLMQAVQRVVVEGSDALVLSDVGNALALGSHYLRFPSANRYRLSTGFGSMGQGAAGALGAALGYAGKAVAIVGDGALMMQNEIHTASTYGLDVVWIVLNDSRYGMISQGMRSIGWEPFEVEFPRIDFVAVAQALGVPAREVAKESDVESAIEEAMAHHGPYLIDVLIDPNELAPSGRRNQQLAKQGVGR